jgi:16S rRNA (uracil1498-N3)-methyltransferase
VADRFYTPETPTVGEFTLVGADAHHLVAVRRIGVGESIVLFNGDGREYPAEVIGAGKKSVHLLIGEPRFADRERPVRFHVASAIPKGDRVDVLIEKLVELGVAHWTPIVAERSVVRPKSEIVAKYERIVIEASKQCGRNALMGIDAPQPWMAYASRTDLPERKIVLHPIADAVLAKSSGPAVVAIGPEGGFTESESRVPGWERASMGPTILRIETAAIAAASLHSV